VRLQHGSCAGITGCVDAFEYSRPSQDPDPHANGGHRFVRLPETVHEGHINKAQAIFESWLGETVTCFIPPGNVFAEKTLAAARRNGLITVSCNTETRLADGLMIIGDEHITSFHDRDIVVNGMDWFRRLLMEHQGKPYAFVSETAKTLPNQQAKAI